MAEQGEVRPVVESGHRDARAGTSNAASRGPNGAGRDESGRYFRGGILPRFWRWLFGRGQPAERPAGTTDPERWVNQGLGVVAPAVMVAAIVSVVVYAWSAVSPWAALGVGLAVVAGSAAAGGFLGFLFGIPSAPVVKEGEEGQSRYKANTSLEKISEWLTAIIVGVGLVELKSLGPQLGALVDSAADGMGGPSARPVAAGLLVVSFVVGFLMAYLATRTMLPRMLSNSDVEAAAQQAAAEVRRSMDEQGVKDATAQSLVSRVLAGDGAQVSDDDLAKALGDASTAFRVLAFSQAYQLRRQNWDKPSALVVATMQVFRALIKIDVAGRFHRNHAQLGYALATMGQFPDALEAFNTAIDRRPPGEAKTFFMYDAMRALCRVETKGDDALIAADVLFVRSCGQNRRIAKMEALAIWVAAHPELLEQPKQ